MKEIASIMLDKMVKPGALGKKIIKMKPKNKMSVNCTSHKNLGLQKSICIVVKAGFNYHRR